MKKSGSASGEKAAKALLEEHDCPVPFHAVRTRFLGSIATPAIGASPMRTVEGLWGGELPVLDSIEALEKLLETLLQGLWNDLTRHQKRSQPFRLTRVPMEPSAANLDLYGRIRREELDGFIDGLFNGEEAIDLPERAHHAVGRLHELRAIMAGLRELASRGSDAGTDDPAQLDATFKNLRELTRIMEIEIHEAVLSCTRARRQMLEGLATRSTVH
jgi:hypothetical protein